MSVQITCQLLSVSQSVPSARHLYINSPLATTLKPRAASQHHYIQIARLIYHQPATYASILQVAYSLQDFVQLWTRFFLSTSGHMTPPLPPTFGYHHNTTTVHGHRPFGMQSSPSSRTNSMRIWSSNFVPNS